MVNDRKSLFIKYRAAGVNVISAVFAEILTGTSVYQNIWIQIPTDNILYSVVIIKDTVVCLYCKWQNFYIINAFDFIS